MDRNSTLSQPASSAQRRVSADEYAWSRSRGKRLFDVVFATVFLLLAFPLMLPVALLIKCSSAGPLLFRQFRLGQYRRSFELLKFRTMTHARRDPGPGLTRQGDPRVFPAGRWLRRWKLDELPQFFNVVRGDMSLVGPRPDLPEYFATLTGQQQEILTLRPGITGSAALHFRHEEKLLAQVDSNELQYFYTSQVLPEKIRMDWEYARDATFLSDIRILLRTAAAIFS